MMVFKERPLITAKQDKYSSNSGELLYFFRISHLSFLILGNKKRREVIPSFLNLSGLIIKILFAYAVLALYKGLLIISR